MRDWRDISRTDWRDIVGQTGDISRTDWRDISRTD